MTHTYKVSGMTCGGCVAKVQGLLLKVPGAKNVTIELAKGEATIQMDNHIATIEFQMALKDYPKYQLLETIQPHQLDMPMLAKEDTKSWPETYKPLLLIFGYIIGITLLVEYIHGEFLWMRWMSHFMAGFFFVFSFFKLLDLKGFSESYGMYDIVAKNLSGWGYAYAFIELALGIAFLSGVKPILTNAVTFVVMAVSVIGVLQTVVNKRKIKCACLGTVFNLPMTTVTIIEDALMIGMSGIMIINIL